MESQQGCCPSFKSFAGLGADEDLEQKHGGNVMLLDSGEEGGKPGLVQVKLAQGKLAQGNVAQEELAQVSPPLEATGVVQEEEDEEEMGEGPADGGASGSMEDKIHPGQSEQELPQQEAAIPEGAQNPPPAVDRVPHRRRRRRFTLSQLQDLERLFHETRYPSLRARKDLARWMGVSEADVQDWFRTRRSIFRKNNRLLMICNLPPSPPNNAS
ncbi:homeobox protein ESX1-like [Acomys russatus]|uniref:homeobox protein ESX1-like n=1 Tax=Acomys russatus TaxID=60746 RepID=UPI0021E2211D|nr:homeobox protein ESX1-like [Acomys russatus]